MGQVRGTSARALHRLSAVKVGSLKDRGYHSDGGGLYLRVAIADGDGGKPRVLKSWVFRYERNGRAREAGLGSAASVSLAAARTEAQRLRQLLAEKIDPIENRRASADARHVSHSMTFKECADAYLIAHEPTWKNPKHRQQWRNTLKTYVYPKLGAMPTKDIGVTDVLKVLEPIWQLKPETGSRVRGRIETVLSYAKALGHRDGENPGVWKDNLAQLLPAKGRVRRVRHHSSLPYTEVPRFFVELRDDSGFASSALKFCILCASRTAEVLGATFDEFDLDARVWTIPPHRMKGGREHRVPLSPRAVAIVKEMQVIRQNEFLFPGMKLGKPLSQQAMNMVMRRAGYREFTVHGFRSSFRDWSAECTSVPREIAEFSLAHTIPDETERAYLRTTLFDKRRELMLEWEQFVLSKVQGKRQGTKLTRAGL